MRIKTLVSITSIVLILVAGCNSDDETTHEKTINGNWYLTNVKGGLASVNINYNKGDIKWVFDEEKAIVNVENKIGNSNAFVLHSGSYTFNIENDNKSQVLNVDNSNYRIVIVSIGKNLVLSDGLIDGFTAEFNR